MRRALEDRIVERQERLAEIERERIRLDGEIAAYMDMLSLCPATPGEAEPATPDLDGRASSSRLSDMWSEILRHAVTHNEPPLIIDEILDAGIAVGSPVERGTARSQMASRIKMGDFIRTQPGYFEITARGRSTLGLPVRE